MSDKFELLPYLTMAFLFHGILKFQIFGVNKIRNSKSVPYLLFVQEGIWKIFISLENHSSWVRQFKFLRNSAWKIYQNGNIKRVKFLEIIFLQSVIQSVVPDLTFILTISLPSIQTVYFSIQYF